MSERGFDPTRALKTLTAHGVEFVIIGGIAGRLWGSPTVTSDLDVCYSRAPANLERLVSALRELHAALRGVSGTVPFRLKARTIAAGDHFTFTTDAGDLDCLAVPAGTNGYEDLNGSAREMDVDGLTVRVASVDDLIDMKRAAGRPKDRIEVEVLAAVRDERRRKG